ncbi:MAG: paraquat-inducible protein A [Planctomycetota bacterium]
MDPGRTNEGFVRSCHCCGLAHWVEPAPAGLVRVCSRCATALPERAPGGGRTWWAVAAALAALVLYPLAVGLPVMEIEQLGHSHAASVAGGTYDLLLHGELVVGLAVLTCSLVFPLLKLAGLVVLGIAPRRVTSSRARARLWHGIEFVGRWGTLDVLLVALLVAVLKLGDLVAVHPGPGVSAFTVMVGLSLLSSALFDSHAMWADEEHLTERHEEPRTRT